MTTAAEANDMVSAAVFLLFPVYVKLHTTDDY